MQTLRELKPNQSAKITSLDGDSAHAMRLCALGFVPGAIVNVFKATLMGGPSIYQLQDSKIALRSTDADAIHVSLN